MTSSEDVNTFIRSLSGKVGSGPFIKNRKAEWLYPKELSLAEIERKHILSVLQTFKNNRTHAANALRISLRGLRIKLRSYGI